MAALRSQGLLLCCLVILLATHEVEGLFECLDGCPTRCQKEFHESLFVCAIFCGMRCTCTGGDGTCGIYGTKSKFLYAQAFIKINCLTWHHNLTL